MDYISYVPPIDYYIIDDESEEQIKDLTYQYGDIEKILNIDSVTEISKVDTIMEIDTITDNLKTVSIEKVHGVHPQEIQSVYTDNARRRHYFVRAAVRCNILRKSAYTLLKEFDTSSGSVLPGFAPKAKTDVKTEAFPLSYLFFWSSTLTAIGL